MAVTPSPLAALGALDPHEQEYVAGKQATMPPDQLAEDIRQYRAINASNAQPEPNTAAPAYTPEEIPEGHVPTLNDYLDKARPLNPDHSDKELVLAYQEQFPTGKPAELPSLTQFLKDAKAVNPDHSDAELTEYWQDRYEPFGAQKEDLGFGGTILEGAKGTARSVMAAGKALIGDEAGVVQSAQDQQNAPQDPALKELLADIAAGKAAAGEDTSWFERGASVGKSLATHLKGSALLLAEQIPNSLAVLGSAGAGALIGTAIAPGVGTAIGGIAGLFLGDIALETGAKALEAGADKTFAPEERTQVLKEGAVKGSVIGAVDTATFGLTKWLTGTVGRAMERATVKVLTQEGVDVADKAAVLAARQDPAILSKVTIAQQQAREATTTLGQRVMRGTGEAGLETLGEGVGEYIGEVAATGKGDKTEALIEAFAGLGQSAGEISIAQAMSKAQRSAIEADPLADAAPILAEPTVDQVIETARKVVNGAEVNPQGIDELLDKEFPKTEEAALTHQAEVEKIQELNTAAEQKAQDTKIFADVLDGFREKGETTSPITTDEQGNTFFRGGPVETLTRDELPATTLPTEGMSQEKYDAMDLIANALGKRLLVYKSNETLLADGLVNRGTHPDAIFLADTTRGADSFTVFAHEAIHLTEGTHFHDAIRDVVWATRTPESKALAIRRHGDLPQEQLLNEVVADISGTELQKPEVWEQVFSKLQERLGDEKAKTETLGFIDTLKDLITKVKELITSKPWSSGTKTLAEQYVKDLSLVHDALATAVANQIYEAHTSAPKLAAHASPLATVATSVHTKLQAKLTAAGLSEKAKLRLSGKTVAEQIRVAIGISAVRHGLKPGGLMTPEAITGVAKDVSDSIRPSLAGVSAKGSSSVFGPGLTELVRSIVAEPEVSVALTKAVMKASEKAKLTPKPKSTVTNKAKIVTNKPGIVTNKPGIVTNKPKKLTKTGPKVDKPAAKVVTKEPDKPADTTGKKAVEKEEHDYASTQINLPPAIAKRVFEIGQQIKTQDLAEKGREENPHITVKYGLHSEEPGDVATLLAHAPPVTATIGELSMFETDDGDVIILKVTSPDLAALNEQITTALPNTTAYANYKPHITVAYVKTGLGKGYLKTLDNPLKDQSLRMNEITFSDKAGKETSIPLTKGQSALTPETIHALADKKGIPWDNDPSFKALTKKVTGKEHLDDLSQDELQRMVGALTAAEPEQTRTYEEIQKDIDEAEEVLDKAGVDIGHLYNPLQPESAVLDGYEDWKPMPQKLAELYLERFAVEAKDKKEFLAQVVKDSGLPAAEVTAALKDIFLDQSGLTSHFDDTLKRWSVDTSHNLTKLYNHFAAKKYDDLEMHYAKFAWGGTGDKPVMTAHVERTRGPLDRDLLNKVESIYNAVGKSIGNDPISLAKEKRLTEPTSLSPAPGPHIPKNVPLPIEPPSRLDKVIRVLSDKHIDIKRVVEGIHATGARIQDDLNPIFAEEMVPKRVQQRGTDYTNDELLPFIEAMRLHKVTLEQVDQYAHARHIIVDNVNERLKALNPTHPNNEALSGMTDAQAQAILDRGNAPVMDALLRRLDAMVNTTRAMMVEYGLEKQSTIDKWKDEYQAYVPLRREGFDEKGYPTGTGRSVKGSTVRRRGGSTLKVENVLANIAQARDQIITRGENQKPVIAFAGLMMLHPDPTFARLDKPAEITTTDPETGLTTTVPGDLAEYKVPLIRRYDPNTDTFKMVPDPAYKGRDNVVNFRVKGIDYSIVFKERNERARLVARAFKDLDTVKLNVITEAIAPYTRYLAAINTQYNPIFGVVNFVRDAQFAMLALSSTPLKGMQATVLKNTIWAMGGIYRDARAIRKGTVLNTPTALLYERFAHVGGPSGYRDLFFTASDRAQDIESLLNPEWRKIRSVKQFSKRVERTPVFSWLSDYNLTMENAIRLGVFKTAVDKGLSDIHAASLAKNITVNFNKKGQWGAQMGSLFAFFNANVQGTARIAETLFERTPKGFKLSAAGKKIIAGGILLGVLQTFALMMAGFDDDDIPEFVKQKNFVYPAPWTDKKYGMLPMALGFNLLPSVGRLAAESVANAIQGRPVKVMEKGASLMGSIVGALSPTGGSGSIMQELAPTVLDPIAALKENRDGMGKPIYKEDLSSRDPTPGRSRAHDTATVWAKGLSTAINWATGGTDYVPGVLSPTPDAIDYLIQTATGGVGREVSKAAQVVESVRTGEELPPHKVPLLGRFVGSASGPTAVRAKYNEHVRDVNLAYREFEGRAVHHEPFSDFVKTHPIARFHKAAETVDRDLSLLRKQKQMMLDRGASHEAIKLHEERVTALMNRFNRLVEGAK